MLVEKHVYETNEHNIVIAYARDKRTDQRV